MNIYKSRYQYSTFDKIETKRLISRLVKSFNDTGIKIKSEEDTNNVDVWPDFIISDEEYESTNKKELLIEIVEDENQNRSRAYSYKNRFVSPIFVGYYYKNSDGYYTRFFKKFVKLGTLYSLVQ